MAALRAEGAESLAEIVVARAAIWHVFVTAGCGGEWVFQEVTDGVAFEEEGLGFLFARYQEKSSKPS